MKPSDPHTYNFKDKDGNVLKTGVAASIDVMEPCVRAKHDVRWGPLCRVMKRKPKGRELVAMECKTCGVYTEAVPK